jgi:hypothetical protein
MAKASKLVNAAAHGLTTSQYHPHWSDVNPIKRQGLTAEDHRARRKHEDMLQERQQRRQSLLRHLFPNRKVLRDLTK